MTLNTNIQTTYHVFDQWGMCVIPSDEAWSSRSLWKKIWDWILTRIWFPILLGNRSWRDSLGRTILCGLAYGFTQKMIDAIESCYRDGILYRHPNHDEIASRDHHSYFYLYRKYTGQELPDFPRMRGMNQWMRVLKGDNEFWYYFWNIPGARLGNWWLKTCRRIGRINPERDNNFWITKWDGKRTWGEMIQKSLTTWQKIWARIIFVTIPAYPLHNKAWQLYVMPDSKKKEKIKRILLKRVAKSNLMLRLLFGDEVTQEEIDSYPNMTGYRPSTYLDETCRRDVREMTPGEAEANCYEKDLIIWLWKQRQE